MKVKNFLEKQDNLLSEADKNKANETNLLFKEILMWGSKLNLEVRYEDVLMQFGFKKLLYLGSNLYGIGQADTNR